MLQHENPNIEIINENLWAVRYALIPLIPQINYKPNPNVPLEHLPSQISPNGVLLLNKDFKWYEILRKNSVIAMKLTTGQIKKRNQQERPGSGKNPSGGNLSILLNG